MNIKEHEIYKQYKPADGSKLHQLIQAQIEGQEAVAHIEGVIAELTEEQQQAINAVANISWNSDLAAARQAIADKTVLEVMLQKAKAEQIKRGNAARLADKPLDSQVANMRAFQQEVDSLDRAYEPKDWSEVDIRRKKEAARGLEDAQKRLLQAA